MPRKGHQYPIDDGWKERVRARLQEMGISQNELARLARISKASMSAALSKESLQSAVVPAIHKALGWPVPPLVLSADALEMISLYDEMDPRDQGGLLERARASVEATRRDARHRKS
jgi:transcriptional regulator with XRE-family HTH domain